MEILLVLFYVSLEQSWKDFTKKIYSKTLFTLFQIFRHASLSLPVERKKENVYISFFYIYIFCILTFSKFR